MPNFIIKRGKTYSFKMVVDGKRIVHSLHTTVREVAIKRARNMARDIQQGRFDRVFAVVGTAPALATVGQVVERYVAARELQNSDRTRRGCGNYLRKVVEVGLPTDDPDSQSVAVLTADLVFRYQRAILGRAGRGHLEQDRAAETANSAHTQARSVFSKRAMQRNIFQGLELGPGIDAFCKAPPLSVLPKDNYLPPDKAMVAKVWQAAESELRQGQPKLWVAFWLAGMAGLRKSEILGSRWSWISESAVVIPVSDEFVAKGKRARYIPAVPALRQRLLELATEQGWPTGPDDLVLPGENLKVRQNVFRDLGLWMKLQGWDRRQKAHELRKLFATAVCATADSYTAQMALGHREIETTMRYAARPALKAVDASAVWGGR